MECGSPRLDFVIRDDKSRNKDIKKKLNISNNEELVVLYAPTFRNEMVEDVFNIDFEGVENVIQKVFSKKSVVLQRFHPLVNSNFMKRSGIINVSDYPDMYELLQISDIIITDYSSIMFEAAYVFKPVFLFCRDIKNYSEERGWYFELDQLPFPIAINNDELINNILSFDHIEYDNKVRAFLRKLGIVESGYASKMVVDYLCSSILGKPDKVKGDLS